jgi:hypothetical protein
MCLMPHPAVDHTNSPEPRGLSKRQAAAYVGCQTEAAFDRWRQLGIVPPPIPGTNRWDKKALDLALDKASGLPSDASDGDDTSPYQRWRAGRAKKV